MTRPDLTDEQLDALLREANASWRVDAPRDTDYMWQHIETAHFDAPSAPTAFSWRTPSWRHVAMATAAALAIGTGLGRVTASGADDANAGTPVVADARVGDARGNSGGLLQSVSHDDPLRSTTTEYFGETAALLASLSDERGNTEMNARFAADATNLLSTTRLLLDSRTGTDPQLRDLLDDLELVLAQIARLPSRQVDDELAFIAEAIETRDVVPRLQLAAADYRLTAP